MTTIEIISWAAVAFNLGAYAMRTMLPLRMMAVVANVLFVIFAWYANVIPTLVLNAILLPFNFYRIWQIFDQSRRMREARMRDVDPLEFLGHLAHNKRFAKGEVIFAKGDKPDRLYYVKSGSVRLEEIGVTLGKYEIFGEIAFFTDQRQRTLSAHAEENCELMLVDEATFMRAFYQNPAFGLFIMKLITRRLVQGVEDHPQAYAIHK